MKGVYEYTVVGYTTDNKCVCESCFSSIDKENLDSAEPIFAGNEDLSDLTCEMCNFTLDTEL
jgi:hypothetical protein